MSDEAGTLDFGQEAVGPDLALTTLAEDEAVIERGLATFIDVGRRLMAIREHRKYQAEGYADFDAYCRERWGWSKTHANRQIEAARVAEVVTPIGVTPASEAIARELAPLMPADTNRPLGGRPADRPETTDQLVEVVQELQAKHGDKLTAAKVREAVQVVIKRDRITQARERQPAPAITPPTPKGRYRCIVIDPPWPIEKIEREERPDQGAALDYPTLDVYCTNPDYRLDGEPDPCWLGWEADIEMGEVPKPCQSIECIVGSQLAQVAHTDGCHVYLWTTHKFLPDALALFERWGARYQCLMTWRKNVGITPFSWMYDTEHVLFGRIGTLKLEQLGLRLSFEAPAIGHSIKPDVFYERVMKASPEPRSAMFERGDRPGFEVWGNEVAADAR